MKLLIKHHKNVSQTDLQTKIFAQRFMLINFSKSICSKFVQLKDI